MAKKKASTKQNDAAPDFEASLGELESIVAQLETGNLPLAEAIERYEQGVKLLKECHGSLNAVQRKIELLTNVDEAGDEESVPFDSKETLSSGKASDSESEDGPARLF